MLTYICHMCRPPQHTYTRITHTHTHTHIHTYTYTHTHTHTHAHIHTHNERIIGTQQPQTPSTAFTLALHLLTKYLTIAKCPCHAACNRAVVYTYTHTYNTHTQTHTHTHTYTHTHTEM